MWHGGVSAVIRASGIIADVVACRQHKIRLEGVDPPYRLAEEEVFGEPFEMDIRELGNAEAVECLGQPGNVKGLFDDFDKVALNLGRIEPKRRNREGTASE